MRAAKPLTLPELAELIPRLQVTMTALQQIAGGEYLTPAQIADLATDRSDAQSAKNTREEASELRDDILTRLRLVKTGMRVSEITNATGASMEAVRYALKLLRGAHRVKMTGARATARWFAR